MMDVGSRGLRCQGIGRLLEYEVDGCTTPSKARYIKIEETLDCTIDQQN